MPETDLDLARFFTGLGLLWGVAILNQGARYVLSAGVVSLLIARIPALRRRRLQNEAPSPGQVLRELHASLSAVAILALFVVPVGVAYFAGHTRIYRDPREYGLAYLALSFPLLLLIHDAYFYWTHRWLHRPGIYRRLHRRHHESRTPTAWAALAFHPLESVIQGAIYPVIAFALPVHLLVLAAFLVWATFHSALIHSGHDPFLADRGPRWLRWLLGAARAHDAHHASGRGNYALYFDWWDVWCGTRRPSVPTHATVSAARAERQEHP